MGHLHGKLGIHFAIGVLVLVVSATLGLGPAPAGARGVEQPLVQGVDLTGLWQSDTRPGVIYRVRQNGDRLYWAVDGTSQGTYANVFVGTIEGDRIRGSWQDLPGSPDLGGGSLTLRIASNNQFVKVDESVCCYNGARWTRQGSTSVGPGVPETRADWGTTAQSHRGSSGRFTYNCPPNGSPGSVWGTDVYSDDSSVCTAAVHAGAITVARGGTVTIEMAGSQTSFTGSTRNGIASSGYGNWPDSFRVVR